LLGLCEALVLETNDAAISMAELVGALMVRLENPNWNVVLKTLMLVHRLLKDGNIRFMNELKFRPKVFLLDRFQDTATLDGQHNSAFVRKYAAYLEEKVNVFKALKLEFDKKPDACKQLSVDDMFVKLPKLQSLVNSLLNTRVQRADLNNSLVMDAYQYLLKDSFALYTCLSDGMINLIERYFDMSKDDADRALTIYKLFVKETDGIISLYEMCRSFANNVPDVASTPGSLLEAMEQHLDELKAGKATKKKSADVIAAAKKKGDATPAAAAPAAAAAAAAEPAKPAPSAFDVDWTAFGGEPAKPSAAAAYKAAAAAPAAPAFDFFGADPFAPAPTVASPAAAAPAAAVFDPFASPVGVAAAPQETQEEKLRRIMMVQQLSSQSTGAPSLAPLTPQASAPLAASNPFGSPAAPSVFQQQPLTAASPFGASPFGASPFGAQPTGAAASNPFASNPFA
jgi:clathrin coat assembly protein AP180